MHRESRPRRHLQRRAPLGPRRVFAAGRGAADRPQSPDPASVTVPLPADPPAPRPASCSVRGPALRLQTRRSCMQAHDEAARAAHAPLRKQVVAVGTPDPSHGSRPRRAEPDPAPRPRRRSSSDSLSVGRRPHSAPACAHRTGVQTGSSDRTPKGARSPSAETASAVCSQKPWRSGPRRAKPALGLRPREDEIRRVVHHQHLPDRRTSGLRRRQMRRNQCRQLDPRIAQKPRALHLPHRRAVRFSETSHPDAPPIRPSRDRGGHSAAHRRGRSPPFPAPTLTVRLRSIDPPHRSPRALVRSRLTANCKQDV